MDAADYSVGDYGRTHGTGSHLVHGIVERDDRPAGIWLAVFLFDFWGFLVDIYQETRKTWDCEEKGGLP